MHRAAEMPRGFVQDLVYRGYVRLACAVDDEGPSRLDRRLASYFYRHTLALLCFCLVSTDVNCQERVRKVSGPAYFSAFQSYHARSRLRLPNKRYLNTLDLAEKFASRRVIWTYVDLN